MSEARAGAPAPSQKEKEKIPEWIKLVNEYIDLTRNSNKTESKPQNDGKVIGSEPIKEFNGLYGLALSRLIELEKFADTRSRTIRFPVVFEKICKSFQINKAQAWDLLFLLSDIGLIKIIPYQGIRIADGQSIGQILLNKSLAAIKKKYS